jgi:hypothetical protein
MPSAPPANMKAMDHCPPLSAEHSLALRAFDAFLALLAAVRQTAHPAAEPALGGQLVYIGEFDDAGRALVVASNIAGAASLCATADPSLQRLAIRDGIADFVVNSLDEALRILKNEIRKNNPVAVCVAAPPQIMEAEMHERGVLPDLHRSSLPGSVTSGGLLPDLASPAAPAIVSWSVSTAPAHWLPRLDALAAECLPANALATRRWLRLAPRYLGRSARNVRLLCADHHFAAAFLEKVQAGLDAGEISVPVQVEVRIGDSSESHNFTPRHAVN